MKSRHTNANVRKPAFDRTFPAGMWRGFHTHSLLAALLAMCCPLLSAEEPKVAPAGEAPAAEKSAPPAVTLKGKQVALPGMVINLEKSCVDVNASICLHEGTLELIACTKDSKEHESIVVIEAKPKHIHAGLLLLGARPGNPAMRKAVDDDAMRWIDLPPKGDPIAVSLVFANKDGEMVEHPISEFVSSLADDSGQLPSGNKSETEAAAKFPDIFVFAGSILQAEGKGERQYVADQTGSVISIATFGDELLCLSGVHEQDNDALSWKINSDNLPARGTKVILRLRPVKANASQPAKPKDVPAAPAPNAGKR